MKTAPQSESTRFDPARLIEAHQAGIWRYLRALGCPPNEADDFTQETFLAVFERPFEDFNPAATATYLRRVAYNLVVTAKRRHGRMTVVENVEEFDAAWVQWTEPHGGDELMDRLRDCLRQLTDRARMALDMRFRKKSSRAAIAEALEITEHGAKNLMQRAKKQLRSCIESKLA